MNIDATNMGQSELNRLLRRARERVEITGCLGQRYIASSQACVDIRIEGVPGNALGCYLGSGRIEVMGNAQDATGDTMSGGEIVIHGRSGDATGYAMRGGRILVEGDVGDRTGIHMKQYQDLCPSIVIGGCAGRFLGEYLAGGRIVVLNLSGAPRPVGRYCGAGMHGGRILVRAASAPEGLPAQVDARPATQQDMDDAAPEIEAFARAFGLDAAAILDHPFLMLSPNALNPYHQMYTAV